MSKSFKHNYSDGFKKIKKVKDRKNRKNNKLEVRQIKENFIERHKI